MIKAQTKKKERKTNKKKKKTKVPIGFLTCSPSFHTLPPLLSLPLGKWVKNKLTYKSNIQKFSKKFIVL